MTLKGITPGSPDRSGHCSLPEPVLARAPKSDDSDEEPREQQDQDEREREKETRKHPDSWSDSEQRLRDPCQERKTHKKGYLERLGWGTLQVILDGFGLL